MDDPNAPGNATVDIGSGVGVGTRIGPFKILQLLGEGGFGAVYEAEQSEPVKRRVALKIIKLGMDTREVIARFEAERQALALMDHPHIARVFDAGSTETGRPYFVMELVKGEPITTYCTRHALSIPQRLQLFEQVCAAVQHAHTKGIIHRDLKPSNVLVSTQDNAPFAKVIDFGIAKATSGRLTERTLFTEANLMMGTPLYMSPEQAEGSADIDTRTDIYSLGVILYQLLTDSTPLDSDSLRVAAYAEVQRIIREVEPPRPSVRLSQSARKQLVGVDTRRGMDPGKLARIVRGELDWIVMKAIEKDRARRYETASALAADVQRYLNSEPVLAAPPGTAYRLGKFVRRNKVPVVAGAVVALALLAGIVAFAWQAHIAEEQERIAQQRADELKQVSDFQAEMLGQVDPAAAGALLSDDVKSKLQTALAKAKVPADERDAQVVAFMTQWRRINATDTATDLIDDTILKPAVETIDRKFAHQPRIDAALLQSLADLYRGLGMDDAATPLQKQSLAIRRRVLGNDNPETLVSIQNTGFLLQDQDKFDEAEPFFREALAGRRRVMGYDARDTLSSLGGLGKLLEDQGKLSEAEQLLRDALARRTRAFGMNDPDTLTSLANVAGLLLDEGKTDEAERDFLDTLQRVRVVLGEQDPKTTALENNLGLILMRQGKLAEAESYLRTALDKSRRLEGEENPDTLQSTVNLGALLMTEGKLDQAEPLLRDGTQGSRRVLGEDNDHTLIAVTMYGKLLVEQGKSLEAENELAPSELPIRKVFSDPAPRRVGSYLLVLGTARAGLKKFAGAEADLLEALSISEKAAKPQDKQPRACVQALVDLYVAWDKAEPGKGYAAKADEWKARLAKLDALPSGK